MNEHYREATKAILEKYGYFKVPLTIYDIQRIIFYNLGDWDKIKDLLRWLSDEEYLVNPTPWMSDTPDRYVITPKGEEFLSSL